MLPLGSQTPGGDPLLQSRVSIRVRAMVSSAVRLKTFLIRSLSATTLIKK